jgi:PASTA domain
MRRVLTLGVAVSAVLALASCGGGSTTSTTGGTFLDTTVTTTTTAVIRMPRVAGQDATRAEAILHDLGLRTSYIAVPNKARPGTVLAQHPATGSPVPKGSKATLTISASPGARNAADGARVGTPCGGIIHFTGVPHQAQAIGATLAGCSEAKKLVRTAHGTLGGCETGARCDVGDYTCTQRVYEGPMLSLRLTVRCLSRKPPNVPGPQAEVFWQWAGYDTSAGVE